MSEQQYRVIADRNKGDDPTWADTAPGDRVTVIELNNFDSEVVRIERPLPAIDDSALDHLVRPSDGGSMGGADRG